MKPGDLVRHIQDRVFGVVLDGPTSYEICQTDSASGEVYNPRFKVIWEDHTTSCEEDPRDMELISEAPEKK